MPEPSGRTAQIQTLLERLLAGDESARKELHVYTYRRFLLLTKTILRGDPVHEEGFTSDVWHIAWEKVEKDLDKLTKWKNEPFPAAQNKLARQFISRVGSNIRWSVVDIGRSRHGAKGKLLRTGIDIDAEYVPADLFTRLDVQEQVEFLPDDEREIIDQYMYYGVSVVELAELHGTYPVAVRRKITQACKSLAKGLKDYAPEA